MTKPPFQSFQQEIDAMTERCAFYSAKATALLSSRTNRVRREEIQRFQKLSREGTEIVTKALVGMCK